MSKVRYSKLMRRGDQLVETEVKQIDPRCCPHFIFAGEHYRDDGSCKCDDPNEIVMIEWGYVWKDDRWQ